MPLTKKVLGPPEISAKVSKPIDVACGLSDVSRRGGGDSDGVNFMAWTDHDGAYHGNYGAFWSYNIKMCIYIYDYI